jgi:hypothetical protein
LVDAQSLEKVDFHCFANVLLAFMQKQIFRTPYTIILPTCPL